MIPSPSQSDCVLLLVRHGATENNLANPPILQGRGINCGLSDAGIRQAESARGALRDISIDRFFTSPLKRAHQTAEIIAAPHDKSISLLDAITEADVGDWESQSWVSIERDEPELYNAFISNPAENAYKNGESLRDVQQRIMPAFEQLITSNIGNTIAVVAHNVVNRVFLAHAMEQPLNKAREISQDNCGINVLKCKPKNWKLKTLNATLHLP